MLHQEQFQTVHSNSTHWITVKLAISVNSLSTLQGCALECQIN